ncbi:hypothetical protein [Microvirga terricola]|uniref:hypothetical protein n=1 Tax=Microvirga terricola TaxID=2719797 RepID=UPI00197B5FBB
MTGQATSNAWSSLKGSAALAAPRLAEKRRAFDARVLLGSFLPVTIALAWEAAVRFGFPQGRLVPPPSRIITTLAPFEAAVRRVLTALDHSLNTPQEPPRVRDRQAAAL